MKYNAKEWFRSLEERREEAEPETCPHDQIYQYANDPNPKPWNCNNPVHRPHELVPNPHPYKHFHEAWEEVCYGECNYCLDDPNSDLHKLWKEIYIPRLKKIGIKV